MNRLRKLRNSISEFLESADRALMASVFAQVGEPELAREIMLERPRGEDLRG